MNDRKRGELAAIITLLTRLRDSEQQDLVDLPDNIEQADTRFELNVNLMDGALTKLREVN